MQYAIIIYKKIIRGFCPDENVNIEMVQGELLSLEESEEAVLEACYFCDEWSEPSSMIFLAHSVVC